MNSYITKSLENDEKVVLRGRYHWTFTASKIICAWIFAIVSVALLIATRYYSEYKTTLLVMAASAMVLALINTLWGYILRSRTEFAVTDTRFIQKDGILDISIKEIPLYKVETVNFSQSLLQRIVGTGNIELVGSGGTTHQLTFIANPMEVKKAIARAISNKEKMQNTSVIANNTAEEK
ncbi:MAG: PH domain-containing protein [Paraprevotella sp.]|nr:PH domain-containing protein [Paraprevotella sp.]